MRLWLTCFLLAGCARDAVPPGGLSDSAVPGPPDLAVPVFGPDGGVDDCIGLDAGVCGTAEAPCRKLADETVPTPAALVWNLLVDTAGSPMVVWRGGMNMGVNTAHLSHRAAGKWTDKVLPFELANGNLTVDEANRLHAIAYSSVGALSYQTFGAGMWSAPQPLTAAGDVEGAALVAPGGGRLFAALIMTSDLYTSYRDPAWHFDLFAKRPIAGLGAAAAASGRVALAWWGSAVQSGWSLHFTAPPDAPEFVGAPILNTLEDGRIALGMGCGVEPLGTPTISYSRLLNPVNSPQASELDVATRDAAGRWTNAVIAPDVYPNAPCNAPLQAGDTCSEHFESHDPIAVLTRGPSSRVIVLARFTDNHYTATCDTSQDLGFSDRRDLSVPPCRYISDHTATSLQIEIAAKDGSGAWKRATLASGLNANSPWTPPAAFAAQSADGTFHVVVADEQVTSHYYAFGR